MNTNKIMNTESITINGKPLDEFLGAQKAKELEDEIRKEYNRTIGITTKIAHSVRPRLRQPLEPERHGRTKRLSDEEIRALKGVSMKTLGSSRKDILWLLMNRDSLTTKEAAKELNKPITSLSSLFTQITRALGDEILTVTKPTGSRAKVYEMAPEYRERPFEELYSIILNEERESTKKKPVKNINPAVEKREPQDFAEVQLPATPTEIVVRITGSIEINFNFPTIQ